MRFFPSLRSLASALFHRSQIEDDMEEELRAHIGNRAHDLERFSLPRAEAERRARLELGGYQKFKEECREPVRTPRKLRSKPGASVGRRYWRFRSLTFHYST
jgi:hypothetical protein